MIANAIDNWKKLSLDSVEILNLRNKMIPYTLTPTESRHLRSFIKHQRGQETPFALIKKIACVLKRKEETINKNGNNHWMAILRDFSECLSENGALLDV